MKKPLAFYIKLLLLAVLLANLSCDLKAQKSKDAYVDKKGVLRWGRTGAEVQGFGINYTVPFAHAYRAAEKLNVSHEKAIDDDVYHFARLGFDAYRVHVWDTEISDSVGNLLENEHLRLFDYMLQKMKERGMKFIITPIAYWGNGYPEPEEKTPGFAAKYGKADCLTNEDAIKAQEKYLFQFLNHVNPYTGIAYKDDPDIIAFEVSNEPHHEGTPEEVTRFIGRMLKSMKATGCKKPIFYNVSHKIHLVDAYYKAGIQGGTFQWYPTGLGSRHILRGNLLPNVDDYNIPFADHKTFGSNAKMVYEFDAADVGASYIYPAMAREFREAGIQWAAHFAYDPTYMAYANTEYNTHYMNLAYTPQKALALKLASEVFHHIPMYADFGKYPDNMSFGPFRVSYEEDLAEMTTAGKFIYTNTTATQPKNPAALTEIAGFASSPVVSYEGKGAYFLDKIEAGVWRLEVMPDAVWIDNPFGRNSLRKKVAVIRWKQWPMSITLPDIGEGFDVRPLNDGNTATPEVRGTQFEITPGTYMVVRKGAEPKADGESSWKNISLKEFVAPTADEDRMYVLHKPVSEVSAGAALEIEADIVSADFPEVASLVATSVGRPQTLEMKRTNGYTYRAGVPAEMVKEGFLYYYIVVRANGKNYTYPAAAEGAPFEWDFYQNQPYQTRIVPAASPVVLFNAATDSDELSRQWQRSSQLVPVGPSGAELVINPESLYVPDSENKGGEQRYDYSMRYQFGEKVSGRLSGLQGKQAIVFRGRALNGKNCRVQLALIMRNGVAFGGMVEVKQERGEYVLSLDELEEVRVVTLPRPYPTFLPYYFKAGAGATFDIGQVESLQLSIGPGLAEEERNERHGFAVEIIELR